MQKYVKMLEDNVEWVALGIGALFVLLMLWTYVFQTPVKVTVNGQERSPGEIDSLIVESGGPATRLENAINADAHLPPIPWNDFRQEIIDELALRNFAPPVLAPLAFNVAPLPSQGTTAPDRIQGPGMADRAAPLLMARLPKPPQAIFLNHSKGRSTVNKAPINQPGMGGVLQPAGGAGSAVDSKDIDWVTVSYNVDPAEITKEYKAANVAPQLYNQCIFLTVELLREELLDPSADKWSEPVLVKPLTTVQLQPFPGDKAGLAAGAMFEQWAQKNQADILQPAFYPILNGDKWWQPGTPNPNEVVLPPAPAVQPPPDDRPARPARQRPQPQPRNNRRQPVDEIPDAFRGYQPTHYAPLDPDRPTQLAQANPGVEIDGPSNRGYTPPPNRGGYEPSFFPPDQGFQGGPVPAGVPAGNFDPAAVMGKFEIRAHDDSVKAGHTYRYKLRYRLKNPAYGHARLVDPKNPQLAAVFGVQSEDSVATSAIQILPRVNFFVVGNKAIGNKVQFEIFKWENGQQRSKVFDVGVGDMVGSKDATADFTTGWTVVDIRGQNNVILLIDDQGRTERRSLDDDAKHFKPNGTGEKLRQEVQRANAAAAAAVPGQPAVP